MNGSDVDLIEPDYDIHVMVPDMPSADQLLPYLRRIDRNAMYSNAGPLVQELEALLCEMKASFGTLVCNGTTGIELALRALLLPRGSLVAIPAMAFPAVGMAVHNAGLTPVLCDVDAIFWQLRPEHVREAMEAQAGRYAPRIRAAIPVATFGMSVRLEQWEEFAWERGIELVIDAAAALTTQAVSKSHAVVCSMHATKFIGAGEGGVVLSGNEVLIERVRQLANFGHLGTNARMSEYHAAVGLASLARIDQKRAWTRRLNGDYESLLTQTALAWKCLRADDNTLMPVALRTMDAQPAPDYPLANAVREHLAAARIETRRWYAPFLNERRQFDSCLQIGDLKVTREISRSVLGLPFHRRVYPGHVARINKALSSYLL